MKIAFHEIDTWSCLGAVRAVQYHRAPKFLEASKLLHFMYAYSYFYGPTNIARSYNPSEACLDLPSDASMVYCFNKAHTCVNRKFPFFCHCSTVHLSLSLVIFCLNFLKLSLFHLSLVYERMRINSVAN